MMEWPKHIRGETVQPAEFGPFHIAVDPAMPEGTAVVMDSNGRIVQVITNLDEESMSDRATRIYRALFTLLFAAAAGFIAVQFQLHDVATGVTPFQWFLLFAATFGAARIVAREKVASPLRDFAEGTPLQELVNCPRCIGVWIALVAVTSFILFPTGAMVPLVVFSIAGVNILLQEVMGILTRTSELCDQKLCPMVDADQLVESMPPANKALYDELRDRSTQRTTKPVVWRNG